MKPLAGLFRGGLRKVQEEEQVLADEQLPPPKPKRRRRLQADDEDDVERPAVGGETEIDKLLSWATQASGTNYSSWENDFLSSIKEFYAQRGTLTPKQLEVLKRIAQKANYRGL